MKIRILRSKLHTRISIAVLMAAALVNLQASPPVLVDSFLGGSAYANSPFRGTLGITPIFQELGEVFTPNTTSFLNTINVSIFVQPGTTGSARMTLFRYDQSAPGTSVTLGPDLGFAVVPQGNYSGLVPFDFSSQNIQLTAGQQYAFMLSNPDATSFSGFDNSWRADYFSGAPGLTINSSSTYGSFNYFTYPLNYQAHYQVYATVPEPGVGSLLAVCLVAASVRRTITRTFQPH